MKKFVIAGSALALLLLGLYCAVFYGGFFLDLNPHAPVAVPVKSEGTRILLQDAAGEYQPFEVRGVGLSAASAGHFSTDYAVDEATWLRWFGLIREMGANTLRIYTIYDDTFYNALYRFNAQRPDPLYLLQGIQVSEAANAAAGDAYAADFYEALREDGLMAVDVVHGRKNIAVNAMKGSGSYRRDVSPWVLGYVVGNEWDAGKIAYTDHTPENPTAYAGTYLCTSTEASAFEALLAQVMDAMTAYETRKYRTQRLIGLLNTPETDPFAYETAYAKQLAKYAHVDAEHILPTQALQSGCFAAYRLYEFCPGFAQYLSEAQQAALADILPGLDATLYYEGYPQLLARYHSMPVVVTDYGFSSARGTDSAQGPLTEREQGERLMETFADLRTAGCAGACISTWQDDWGLRSWNTAYAKEAAAESRWHDIQTLNQCTGLLAFDPGEAARACVLDGDPGEWEGTPALLSQDGLTLRARYDAEGLYLLVEGVAAGPDTPLYLPIDVTPQSGARACLSPALSFARAADFLLCLDGVQNSRLLVQARYEALRAHSLEQLTGEDPFVEYPAADSPAFLPIRMLLQNRSLVEPGATEAEITAILRSEAVETGLLHHGVGDPSRPDYDSLADFCFGEGCVEVRIPWLLLNFSDPSQMEAHDDYYACYGVEWSAVHALYLGVGTGEAEIPMAALPLSGWGERPAFHERLKQSYEIVKESWGDAHAA